MKDRIDPESPVPLYRQVAEAVRYHVATGELAPGRRLPSLRQAARLWGVNLHTIRRAYAELATRGIVVVRPRSGAVVLGDGRARAIESSTLESFLRDVLRQGNRRWGLTPLEMMTAMATAVGSTSNQADVVHVTECSERQARDLATQLEARWRVRAEPWSLSWEGEPGPGAIVATYFHYNDVRRRWPLRFPSVRFAPIKADPALRDRLDAIVGRSSTCDVVLCERTEEMARNIAADLRRILPPERYRLRIQVGRPAEILAREHGPVLLAPRMWNALPDRVAVERALEVRYVFEAEELDRLGAAMRWESR